MYSFRSPVQFYLLKRLKYCPFLFFSFFIWIFSLDSVDRNFLRKKCANWQPGWQKNCILAGTLGKAVEGKRGKREKRKKGKNNEKRTY